MSFIDTLIYCVLFTVSVGLIFLIFSLPFWVSGLLLFLMLSYKLMK